MDRSDIIYDLAEILNCDARKDEPLSRHTTFKIGGTNFDDFADFIEKINTLAAKTETQFTFLVSADEKDLPQSLSAVAEKI